MAQIRLREWETDAEHLPMTCMVCGEPAVTHVRKKFTWAPEWLSILAFLVFIVGTILALLVLILYFALRKQMLVEVPTCERHQGYWRRRILWAYLPLVLLLLAGVAEVVFMVSLDAGPDREIMYGPCFGTAIGAFIWLVIAAVVQKGTVQAASISDRDITLKKVHEKFAESLVALRRAEREEVDEDLEDVLEDDVPRRRPAGAGD